MVSFCFFGGRKAIFAEFGFFLKTPKKILAKEQTVCYNRRTMKQISAHCYDFAFTTPFYFYENGQFHRIANI